MIAARPDLLIIGGLAIDRLADGSLVAGGSVLHGARAVVAAGRRIATITAAGPEPEASAAIIELSSLGRSLASRTHSSIRYTIHDGGPRRRLLLESGGAPLAVEPADLTAINPAAVLLAPIAAELTSQAVRACAMVPVRVAVLQGWLRRVVPGEEVRPLALDALGEELTMALADLDALVASEEDLAAVAPVSRRQVDELRAHFGPRPVLVITAGEEGAWFDSQATGPRLLAIGRPLAGISTLGAGDAFAALLAVGLGAGLDPLAATTAALGATARYLGARRT
jgi:sugar/nucleoside kinase (ribokinase family)